MNVVEEYLNDNLETLEENFNESSTNLLEIPETDIINVNENNVVSTLDNDSIHNTTIVSEFKSIDRGNLELGEGFINNATVNKEINCQNSIASDNSFQKLLDDLNIEIIDDSGTDSHDLFNEKLNDFYVNEIESDSAIDLSLNYSKNSPDLTSSNNTKVITIPSQMDQMNTGLLNFKMNLSKMFLFTILNTSIFFYLQKTRIL